MIRFVAAAVLAVGIAGGRAEAQYADPVQTRGAVRNNGPMLWYDTGAYALGGTQGLARFQGYFTMELPGAGAPAYPGPAITPAPEYQPAYPHHAGKHHGLFRRR